jgi:hypothetical protein
LRVCASIVKCLFGYYNVFVKEYVSDHDSSCQKNLTHLFSDLILAAKLTNAEWPRYKNGQNKSNNLNNGLLPVEHPKIEFLADTGHMVRI